MASTVTPLRSAQSPWICQHCKKPIATGDGAIEIRQRTTEGKIEGYPHHPTPEPPSDGSPEALTPEVLNDMVYGRVSMTATHFGCDPHGKNSSYQITVERAATLEQWCSWVLHLNEKNWMGKDDIHRLLKMWFTNRGIDYGSLA